MAAESVMKWRPHGRNTGIYVQAHEVTLPISAGVGPHGSQQWVQDWNPASSIADAWRLLNRAMETMPNFAKHCDWTMLAKLPDHDAARAITVGVLQAMATSG